MATSFSYENRVDSESFSSPRLEFDQDGLSFAKVYAGLTKIESLTCRLEYLSTFVSALEETLEFSSAFSFIFRYCSKEIVGLVETARKTLESAGVVPYLWASCPERLLPHKRVYVQLLQLLHSNERDIVLAPQLRRRVRALLMPLTSHFSINRNNDFWQQRDGPRSSNHGDLSAGTETPIYRTIHSAPDLHEARSDMPPPATPPHFRTPIFRRRSYGNTSFTRSIKRRLWHVDELLPPVNPPSRHKHRRDTVRSRVDTSDDEENDDRENSAPEDVGVPFRQPRATLRFGICFTRKSSSQQSGGRVSNTHSLMNYKE